MKPPSRRRWLAGSAALAGALAPFAGSPYRAAPSIDLDELARAVAAHDDHVAAVELAAWIRDRRPGLRVIDLRAAADYAASHIPGAEHVPFDRLLATRFADDDHVVLYSDTGVHGGQAWVLLRALGHRRVWCLRGGLREWLDDVVARPAPPRRRRAC